MTDHISEIFPLGLRLAGRRIVLVGGGSVTARRAASFVGAGAVVEVVSPEVCDDLAALAADGTLTWTARGYRPEDVDGAWLVHTATGDPTVDRQVVADADARHTFCVAAGDATSGTAWVPAVARLDDVVVSVTSSAGEDRNPRRSAHVRDAIADGLRTGTLPVRGTRPRPRAVVTTDPATAERPVGWVALVGGGPGRADLLTVRGRTLLAAADVVVVDRLAPRAVLDELAPDVEVIDVGKTSGFHPIAQEQINALLVEHALQGKGVVRLKGGDPYVFGRGGEELDECAAAGVPVEVVPGVTSSISVPAAVGIPVTHRGLSRGFTVLTGHEDIGKVPAASDHTVVLLMGVSRLAATAEGLVANGRDPGTPAAVVEDGFGARQRVTVGTLATIAERAVAAGVRPPAVTVVGEVVRRAPAWSAATDL
ncbi:uroporphyrinogen-III C-methyltransferase [Sanguibacter suaedae]|uniref:Uroporphyrinogen-III C-methyltransferase n=1 Tax=Sanguibacter suaedae TaxID=2795737 RepID=A0A934M917_9MICO|nr:uroporphyrinogen-III C-methyltransferase [Sanguibacter suaedae]MBI9114130.1 uroporphyrinogen-III C-methyltransferase [Sanguibacter suaedae]